MTLAGSRFAVRILVLLAVLIPVSAQAALTVTPITWNIVGLDSNDVNTGPNNFPVGVRVCSNVATTNVSVNFVWDSANALINLRPGSLSTIVIPSIGAGMCADAYFEVTVTRNAAAFDTARRYHMTATDGTGTYSSPVPREIYVEHLISQNRNSITDIKFGAVGGPYTSVAPGGSMNLVVGNTYDIQLIGGTATQGYNQFEEFINFPNTIFQILGVNTTYSADDSPYVANPNNKLYADACLWENDPNSPNYRSCVGGDFKAGGSTVVTTYTIRIVSGGGTTQPLTSLLYDFSGSSYHYNSDYGTSARIANVIDPTTANIAKSFTPNTVGVNGVSVLTITLTNPNPGPLGGYNFVDNLPANLVIAATPNATTSGCGTPTLTANAGAGTITFSNGTVAANGSCVITVNVRPTTTGPKSNTTNNLFIDAINTGHNASAVLTVNNAPPPGTGLCGQPIARWAFPNGFNTTNPAPTAGSGTAGKGAGVANLTTDTNSTNPTFTADGTISWRGNGGFDNTPALTQPNTALNDYLEFSVNSTGFTSLSITFDARKSNNGPQGIAIYSGNSAGSAGNPDPGTQSFTSATALTGTVWSTFTQNLTSFNNAGTTFIRIYGFNALQNNASSDLSLDNVIITGCGPAIQPTIAKSFSPDPVAVNGVSTLTFTLANTNSAALTNAAFNDTLPAGVQVAATPAASTSCGGTWAPAAGATSLTFSGGTIPASGSCTVSVNVTVTTAGPHSNVSSPLSTTESGTNTNSLATDTITALAPPVIAKTFDPSPILAGGVSTLTFTITNPNQNDALASVAFSDTLPSSPAQMVVAPLPNAAVTNCGSPTFAPAPGNTSLSFTGGTIAGGAICTITVDVTVPNPGTYNNTSGNVSTVINGNTVNGNTAGSSLTADPPQPSISLLKQVSQSASGPWTTFIPVTSGPVFYLFTIENTGDVPLSPISITDNTVDVSSCNSALASATLPPPNPNNENHIVTCVVGPVPSMPGSHTNTAHATGTFNSTPVNSPDSSATYATTGLTLDKSVAQPTFTAAGNVLNYSYLVTNSGFAPLVGPVTITDNKTTATCPAVTTVGDLDNFLDPGESITCTASYIVTAGDVAAAFVTNTAHATVDGVDSNNDSSTSVLNTAADVSIVKTLTTVGPFSVGQSITYTLTVANAGPATATSINVTDTPANLTITNVSGACASFAPCTIASLASGANTVITVTATINAPGAFDNSATATATQPDPNTNNNTDNTGNNGVTGPAADVALTKTLDTAGPPFFHGQTITYTITVTNNGPSTATNINVTDTPTNLAITNVSGACTSFAPCTIASLASGASTNITVTATISAPGPFDNSATAMATETDPTPGNNTDNSGNGGNADPQADVELDKMLSTAGPFSVGGTVTYTITVTNHGPSVANSIQVTDTPSNLTIQTVSSTNCSAFPCTIPSLALNASEVITVTATIDNPGLFNNSATASSPTPDPNVSNNTDNTGNSGNAGAQADVSISKTLNTTGPFIIGQTVSYTIVVTNNGPQPATNINVTDTPTNVTITNVSGDCTALPCTIANLAPMGTANISVTATIVSAGAFDNTASANGTETDPNSSNNSDSTNNGGNAVASADVSITKTLVTSGPFIPGQSVSYTLFIENAGPSTATNVQVTDTPTNLTITNVSGDCNALPCTIPSIGVGGNATINVTATINAAGAFDNSASANATESDPNTNNNTDSTNNGGTAVIEADVSVTKNLDTFPPFYAGNSVTYTVIVSNAGPSTATNVQITDTPTNLTITSVTGDCTALPCTIASIASGGSISFNVFATINAAGPFDNSATAAATETDPNQGNNTDNSGNGGEATALVDVSLSKVLNTGGPYNIGQTVTYTIDVSNSGPSTATAIQITDTPTNLTITNVSGACTALPCTIGSLASGATTSITVTATITATGVFDNSATATPAETDSNLANNTDNVDNGGTTGAAANIGVAKSFVTPQPYYQGDTITMNLLISNAGPDTATNIQVKDSPIGMTVTNMTGGGCINFVFNPNPFPGNGTCTIPSLASGASVNVTVTATLSGTGQFLNSATVTATEFDPITSNNTSSVNAIALARSEITLTKTLLTSGPFVVGQSINYTIVVVNNGPSPAVNSQVTDVPTNLTITSVSGACSALPCTVIPAMLVGQPRTINVTATINAAGPFDNSATITNSNYDSNLSDNTDNSGNGGNAVVSADVSLVKTLTTSGPFNVGQSISYTLVVANAGPQAATTVQVTDTPTNLTITNVNGGGCAALPCTIASIASGASVTINVTATINATGAFDNAATAMGAELDPNLANNTDNSGNNGSTNAQVDLMITKTGPAQSLALGQQFDFTLVVRNNGPGTATNVVVTDPLPSNFTLTSATSTQGTCSGTSTVTCTVGTMLNGATVTITIRGSANAGGMITNTATVSATETDPVTSNNASTASAVAAGGGDTLSDIGLLLLAMVLAGVGVMVMKIR